MNKKIMACIICIGFHGGSFAQDQNVLSSSVSFPDIALEAALNSEFDEYVEDEFDWLVDTDVAWVPFHRDVTQATPEDVLNFYTDDTAGIFLQNRLQENFYLQTNPLNNRPLLDLPQFLLHLGCLPTDWQFTFWMFYNQTSKMNFTKESDKVRDYLDIFNTNILAGIDELIDGDPNVPIDIPTAQRLFSNLKINERRAGAMFDIYKSTERWNIEFKIPFYYFERNYFVKESVQREIENFFGKTEDIFETLKFILSDQVGFGDSRLQAGYIALQRDWGGLNIGAQFTLPTAWAMARGMIGSHFPKNSKHTKFDLLEIGQLVLCPAADRDVDKITKIAADFILSTMNKFSANVLQNSMGNGGHVGFGIFAEKHMWLNRRFMFKTRGAIEYLFPSSERRFYITRKFNQAFVEREPYEDQPNDIAVDKLLFLNEQLINTLIPQVFNTSIYPGFIVKFQTALIGNFGKNWQFGTGYDLWWQNKERLGRIKARPEDLAQLRLDIAIKPTAYQNKLFAVVNHITEPWCWGFYGDYTFLRTGIGKDFNISARLSREF